ncbi:MAG: hypothetical protein ACODAU_12400 [Myxococcota bacterium]
MRGLGSSIALLVLIVALFWAAGEVFGFRVSLWGSLAISVVLTIVLNLIVAFVRSRHPR